MLLLGEASYVLYLFQYPFLIFWLVRTGSTVPLSAGQFAAYGACLVLLSVAIQRFIDRPVSAWLRRRGHAWLAATTGGRT
jgi:peptidoglycan/LPS O-acetylase OafA/YrhL